MAQKQQDTKLLSLQNVGINYSRITPFGNRRLNRWVWRNISLELHDGESLGVIGRNGIGKSSLLRTMAGITHPDEGRVVVRKGCSSSLLTLGVGLMPEVSGRRNIFLGGLMMGMTYEEVAAQYDSVVAFAELEEYIDQPFHTYSSGMKARLGFSLSLHRNPDILLLDEILGVGDAVFRKKSADALKERLKSNQTAVLVSHNPQSIKELCTRAIWIDAGGIKMEGSPEEVTAAYEQSLGL